LWSFAQKSWDWARTRNFSNQTFFIISKYNEYFSSDIGQKFKLETTIVSKSFKDYFHKSVKSTWCGVASILGFIYSHLQNRKKASSTVVAVQKRIFGLGVIEDYDKEGVSPVGSSAEPSRFFWENSDLLEMYRKHIHVFMEAQSRNMLQHLHRRFEFPHFYVFCFLLIRPS
jgi:hypothetical protein